MISRTAIRNLEVNGGGNGKCGGVGKGKEEKGKGQIEAIKLKTSCAKSMRLLPSNGSDRWDHCYCCAQMIGSGSLFTCPGRHSLWKD